GTSQSPPLPAPQGVMTEVNPIKGMAKVIAFSPDGARLALAAGGHVARIYDVATFQPLGVPLLHRGSVNHITFSRDGRHIVTATGDMQAPSECWARIWDSVTGQPLTPPLRQLSIILLAAFSPDGQLVATTSVDGTARVWDVRTGEPVIPPLMGRQGG